MTSAGADSTPPSMFRWIYNHPLTSLIVVALLAVLLALPLGPAGAGTALIAMIAFLTSARNAPHSDTD